MKLLPLLFFILLSTTLWADYHPDINWLSIKTDHFNIIFDEKIEEDAQYIGNKLENYYLSIAKDIGGEIDKYTLVLPGDTIQSNGYVSFINNKSVFYSTPPTESFAGTSKWNDLLAIHETRHMAQYSNIRNSIMQRILGFLFGSYGYASAILIPSYFYEGDAVLTETLLTNSGRGRSPDFERGLRTLLLSDKNYSFAKAFHGSKKDFIPNYYVLGYYLMTYLQREYGEDILEEISKASGNNPFPMNFSTATMLITGESIPDVYKNITAELRGLWSEQDSRITPTTLTQISEDSKKYKNHIYPKVGTNNKLLYIENGLDINSRLVISNNEGKDIIHKVSGDFSIFEDSLIYSKTGNDPRWTYREYSDIYRYDLNRKSEEKLTDKQRFFDPVFSNLGDKIAVIESSRDRTTSLVILDSNSGDIIKSINLAEFDIISGLSWSPDDNEIVFSFISDSGNGLAIYNLKASDYSIISEANNIEKTHPLFYKNSILFISSYSGIYNLHSIDLESGNEFQVISSRFGLNYPTLDKDNIIFSDYTVDGYRVNSVVLDSSTWKDIDSITQDHVDYFSPLIDSVLPSQSKIIEYETERYNPSAHLIDIHSWLVNPFLPVIDNSDVYNIYDDSFFDVSEIVLFSNDYLEYLDTTFYGHYNNRTSAWDLGSYGIYRGLYPKIAFDFNVYSNELGSGISSFNLNTNISLGLSFSDSYFLAGIIPDYTFSTVNSFNMTYYLSYLYQGDIVGITPRVRLGQGILDDSYLYLGFDTSVSLSGFFDNDGFSIYNELILGLNNDYYFLGTSISKPQSSVLDFDSVVGNFLLYSSLEYFLPLFSPDLSIFNWLYFNSVNLYGGYESFYSENSDYNQLVSTRASIEYNLLRMPVDFSSDFTAFYNIKDSSWGYRFNVVTFSIEG